MQPTTCLSHVAVSVAPGTLTDDMRSELSSFYGQHLGWTELEQLRRDDRLTLAVGGGDYVNVRERPTAMTCTGYEHLGVLMAEPADVEAVWSALDADPRDVALEPLARGDDGYRSFRFRYLLPLAIEVQHFPWRARPGA